MLALVALMTRELAIGTHLSQLLVLHLSHTPRRALSLIQGSHASFYDPVATLESEEFAVKSALML